jgi:hypothetical protein
MSQFSQSRPVRRAPRVSLRDSIPSTIQLENGRQLSAKLHRFSITGGMLELASYVEERSWVGLTFQVGSSVVHLTAEMMFPMRSAIGYLQPFRIARIREQDLHLLDQEITALLKQRLSPSSVHGPSFRPPHFYLESS